MIPLRDTIPARGLAWVVRLLVALNLLGFGIELLQGPSLDAFLYRFGLVPSYWLLSRPADVLQWPALVVTLLSSQFLHGSALHLGSNLLYLWIFGDNVEDRLGHGRFLLLYLTSGIVAGALQLMMEPHASVPMIGASGAIAGVLGAYFVLFPFARVVTLLPLFIFWQTIEVPAFVFLGLWFVLQWFQGLSTIGQMAHAGGVAWWAHVGGFACGLGLILLLRPRRHYFPSSSERENVPPHFFLLLLPLAEDSGDNDGTSASPRSEAPGNRLVTSVTISWEAFTNRIAIMERSAVLL